MKEMGGGARRKMGKMRNISAKDRIFGTFRGSQPQEGPLAGCVPQWYTYNQASSFNPGFPKGTEGLVRPEIVADVHVVSKCLDVGVHRFAGDVCHSADDAQDV